MGPLPRMVVKLREIGFSDERAKQVGRALVAAGCRSWSDLEQMGADIIAGVVEGVDGEAAALLFPAGESLSDEEEE